MDLDKLSHAVTVAREGSLSAAAKTIPMSQSALTRSIQSLEKKYGLRLFERSKNGAKLTPEGTVFIAAAEEVLWSSRRADERLIAVATGQNSTVRFGAGPVMTACILPRVLPRLANMKAHFQIRTGSNASLRSLLSQGEIDFFVGGAPAGSDHFSSAYGFRLHPTWTETGSTEIFVRAGHPLTEASSPLQDLSRYPVACASFTRDRLGADGFHALGLQRPSVEVDDYHVLTALVCESDFLLIGTPTVREMRPAHEMTMLSLDTRGMLQAWNWAVVSHSRVPLSAAGSALVDVLGEEFDRIQAHSD
ncbi:LysR family transcriptional regulator [Streptomyces phaeochromogenes]|uniref:LysR family transcriptional regulator n=1 Tax=Streptomyces phaeochromogenes TaxID=1923 RepID=UPI0036917101